ncbi:MAG TPA: FlgD immunoglobulin-like domain containing protein [Gemmatimonadota bacterium]|nr:FlgD immunoglobulin-like domain containing protein [Gemmatimonadota bacterium]
MSRFLAAAALAALLVAAPAALRGQTAQERPGLRLEQNFPNPFTPGVSPTIFTYHLDADSRVTLSVYNLIGQEVVRLVDGPEDRGTHRVAWDGSDANGNFVPAGFYFYKLDAGEVEALGRLRILPVTQNS